MKKLTFISGMIVLMMICSGSLYSEEKQKYSKKLNFSDSSKPGILKIFRGEGDINITGYNGKEVVIETLQDVSEEVDNEKAKGLKRISGSNFSVATDAEENAIIIIGSLFDRTYSCSGNLEILQDSIIFSETNRFKSRMEIFNLFITV